MCKDLISGSVNLRPKLGLRVYASGFLPKRIATRRV